METDISLGDVGTSQPWQRGRQQRRGFSQLGLDRHERLLRDSPTGQYDLGGEAWAIE
jgi:hypothetical protein